jgi:hypothetical protein
MAATPPHPRKVLKNELRAPFWAGHDRRVS